MKLETGTDNLTGGPAFQDGPTHNVVNKSFLSQIAPTLAKAGEQVYRASVTAKAQEDASRVYEAAVSEGASLESIVQEAEQAKVFDPYIKELRRLKAEYKQGITTQDAMAVSLEAMLKRAAVDDPVRYSILLKKVQEEVGYNPAGYLARLQDKLSQQKSMGNAQDNAMIKDLAKYLVTNAKQNPVDARRMAAHYYNMVKDVPPGAPIPEEAKDTLVYRLTQRYMYQQSLQQRSTELTNRLNVINKRTDIAATDVNPAVEEYTNTLIQPHTTTLISLSNQLYQAYASGDAKKIEEIQLIMRKEATAAEHRLNNIRFGLVSPTLDLVKQQGFLPQDATEEDFKKWLRSPVGKAFRSYGTRFTTSPEYDVLSKLITSAKNVDPNKPLQSSISRINNVAGYKLLSEYPALAAIMQLSAAGVSLSAGQGEYINVLIDDVFSQRKDPTSGTSPLDDFVGGINEYNSTIKSLVVTNNMMNGKTQARESEIASDTAKLAHNILMRDLELYNNKDNSKKTATQREASDSIDKRIVINAVSVLSSSDRLSAREQRELSQNLARNPELLKAVYQSINNDKSLTKAMKISMLDKMSRGTEAVYLNANKIIVSAMEDDTLNSSMRMSYIQGKPPYIPSFRAKNKHINIALADAYNSRKVQILLKNPDIPQDQYISEDGTVIKDPLSKLVILSESIEYGLQPPSGIPENEIEILKELLK